MELFTYILLLILLICAVSVTFSKNMLNSILIFMSFSLVMSVIWMLLESPDLAITEAAVGAGVTSVLFFVTLKKIHGIIADTHEGDLDEENMDNIDDKELNDTSVITDREGFSDEL